MSIYGDTIKTLRGQQGVTIEDLAASANMTTERLTEIEVGATPKVPELILAADALGVTFGDLVADVAEEDPDYAADAEKLAAMSDEELNAFILGDHELDLTSEELAKLDGVTDEQMAELEAMFA